MPEDAEAIRAAVEQRFAQVARSPDQERKFPVGPASARKPGYDPPEIDALRPSLTESFCGVGNPLGLGEIRPGQTVLDLGSGPGLDSLLAARRVGPTGKVEGHLHGWTGYHTSSCTEGALITVRKRKLNKQAEEQPR